MFQDQVLAPSPQLEAEEHKAGAAHFFFFVKDPIKYFQLLPSLSQGLNSGCSAKAAVDPR